MSEGAIKVEGLSKLFVGGMLQRHLRLSCWLVGTFTILSSTTLLRLFVTRGNMVYQLSLIAGLGLWLCFIVPWSSRIILTRRMGNIVALAFSSSYALGNFLLARYSIAHFIRVKGDLAIFLQSLWWTLHGLPLFNTIDGTSHLGVHSAFILFALVPIYGLWKSPLVLVLVQALALGSAAYIFFRIARQRLDDFSALLLLLVFLLFPAYQYDFGDFYYVSL